MLYPTQMPSPFNPLPNFGFNSQFQGMEESKGILAAENEGGPAGEDFCVDELLDLSNGFSETEVEELPEMEIGKAKMGAVLGEKREAAAATAAGDCEFSGKEEFEPLRESELGVEAEGLESLEWLSHFVEDSFDYSLPAADNATGAAAAVATPEQPCFATPVQTKARTRRARAGVRVWPVLSSSFSDSPTSSSSSTFSTTSFPPSAPAKKQKRKASDGGGVAQPRRCSHCGVTKTPQWRTGPLGAKTLCNACGVRFKSGRLLPEYRPACSPSFSSELHSNNHRKVLEMRRKKDAGGLPPPVQSF